MREWRFEFDNDWGNDFQIQHSNNKFIDGLLGERLTWLDRKWFYLRKQAIRLCWWHVFWHLFVFKGDTGPVGEMGARGKDGNPVGLQLILLYFE